MKIKYSNPQKNSTFLNSKKIQTLNKVQKPPEDLNRINVKAWEYNFDGLVGPTHNYAGLAIGNKASMKNKNQISHPQKAALEGLEKMKFLMDKGFKQAVLPPHERPDLNFLKKWDLLVLRILC